MIRLAFAVGFLAVFGIVAYAVVVLLAKKFDDSDKKRSAGNESSN